MDLPRSDLFHALTMTYHTRTVLRSILLYGFCIIYVVSTASTKVAPQDGPVSVNLGDVYKKGEIKIEPYELTSLPSLPAGYAALNNKGYRITTTALASGPYVVYFSAASVTDEDAFNDLRIFHAEPDTFDPDAPMWVDRTSSSPGAPAPDFSNKTINASSEELGVFVIGKLVQKIPPSTAIADLAVTCKGSPDHVTAP